MNPQKSIFDNPCHALAYATHPNHKKHEQKPPWENGRARRRIRSRRTTASTSLESPFLAAPWSGDDSRSELPLYITTRPTHSPVAFHHRVASRLIVLHALHTLLHDLLNGRRTLLADVKGSPLSAAARSLCNQPFLSPLP